MTILIYKLCKNYREFGFHYHREEKTFEISFWFFNVIFVWGDEE